MTRDNGYYWVQQAQGDNWEVAEWGDGYWHLFRWYMTYPPEYVTDNDLAVIGPQLSPPTMDPV
jgi:hypothetical protein